jgi:pyruvate dehydrogenase E2 component (dihydrolipoamide acetyltransferase)
MAAEILMPRQGQSVESCIIIEWRKQEGDAIAEGDILCEVETDKATFEVESTAAGTLLSILHPADADVKVLKPIALVGKPGEDISAWNTTSSTESDSAIKDSEPKPAATAQSSAPPAPVSQPVSTASMASISNNEFGHSPRARSKATELGIDLHVIQGSGPHGRIIERDVLNAEPQASLNSATLGESTTIPAKGIRKVVASRMLQSLQNTAQLTLNSSADARSLLRFRQLCKQPERVEKFGKVSINDVLLFATVKALGDFPELNAHWLGDRCVQFHNIHLGFAVDTPRGLMVPVIRNANTRTLLDLSAEAKRLASACIEGTIDPDDLTGGTFTVTNLGAMGIESFTPVLNAPEVAILGVCAIQPKPVISGSSTEFIPHIGLSLTFDHCAADGAPAARFLAHLREKINQLELTLLENL